MKNKLIPFLTLFLIVSCGGGGGGSESVVSPSVSISGPSTISWSSSGPVGCTGSSIDNCIKLTANVSDPQNRISTAQWQNLNTLGGPCYPVTTNANTMSVPLYCTSSGYSCQYSYDVRWYTGTRYEYIQPFHTVNVQGPIPCAAGSAIDGYIQEAKIFADINFNLKQDFNEPVVVSNQLGQFRFNHGINDGTILILKGGIDSTTQVEFPKNYTLIGRASNQEKIVISPISTINFFMPSDYSANDDFEFKSFDVFYDDPLIQMTSPEAIKVLETNMRISILAESLSRITYQNDYIEIYKEITNQLIDADLGLQDISSTKLITNAILNISAINGLSKVNVNDTSLALSNYLNGVIVDDTNQYVDMFNHGINVLPLQLAQFSDGKDIDISMYIN